MTPQEAMARARERRGIEPGDAGLLDEETRNRLAANVKHLSLPDQDELLSAIGQSKPPPMRYDETDRDSNDDESTLINTFPLSPNASHYIIVLSLSSSANIQNLRTLLQAKLGDSKSIDSLHIVAVERTFSPE